jgi:predicted nucleotidyltransferase
MIRDIETRREPLEALCRRFRVRRLDLFGSAVGDRFDPLSSDLDFLVEFEDLLPDLVLLSAVRNPYFRESIQRSRTLLYAA